MARKNNMFKSNNTIVNLLILVMVLGILYYFLGRCSENFASHGVEVDYLKSVHFKPRGSNTQNQHLLVMYYAPWCYYSKVALKSENGFGKPTGETEYQKIQSKLGFADAETRENLGVEHSVGSKTISMAAINCDADGDINNDMCSKAKITAYPTIKLYHLNIDNNKVTDKGEYTGKIDMDSIDEFIKNQI